MLKKAIKGKDHTARGVKNCYTHFKNVRINKVHKGILPEQIPGEFVSRFISDIFFNQGPSKNYSKPPKKFIKLHSKVPFTAFLLLEEKLQDKIPPIATIT